MYLPMDMTSQSLKDNSIVAISLITRLVYPLIINYIITIAKDQLA